MFYYRKSLFLKRYELAFKLIFQPPSPSLMYLLKFLSRLFHGNIDPLHQQSDFFIFLSRYDMTDEESDAKQERVKQSKCRCDVHISEACFSRSSFH